MKNPFNIISYNTPEYFCDREQEVKQLEQCLDNGRNIVLLSLRRMGKTGLIKHLFYKLRTDKKIHTFYLDIMNTNSVEDFVNKLADSVIGTFNSKPKKLFNNVIKFFSKFNPLITFDVHTGIPSIELRPHSEQQAKSSITEILNYLEDQNKKIYIAIDEFQQITNYKNPGFEAFLRSHIQHLKNVNFIFSGSQQHILTSMFSSYSRPFYQSSDFLKLERLPKEIYSNFIIDKFKKSKKYITKETVDELLDWADIYTYYVQNLFNKLWYVSGDKISEEDVEFAQQQLIDERDYIYQNLQNLLPKMQFELIRAIAKNGGIDKPLSKEFINKYNLGTTSTISTAIKSLISKEMIYQENKIYKVYDIFMVKWLEKN